MKTHLVGSRPKRVTHKLRAERRAPDADRKTEVVIGEMVFLKTLPKRFGAHAPIELKSAEKWNAKIRARKSAERALFFPSHSAERQILTALFCPNQPINPQ